MAERPVECGQCKKAAKVTYKEIVGKTITECEMCSDCPILQEKLHGTSPKEQQGAIEGTGLYCGHCHTSLESVKMGNPLGCSECYQIFGDLLVNELIAEERLPKAVQNARRGQPLHMGKSPGKTAQIPPSNRLTSLSEALNEALQAENYEEAAWLRDQIKQLTEDKGEGNDG